MDESKKMEPGKTVPGQTLGLDPAPRPRPRATSRQPRALEIEVLGGPMDGLRSVVRGSIVTIGRSEGNHLALCLDGTVSTRHARLVREGNHYWLEDLGSRNGTYLGDERIHGRTLIGPGTTFTVGRTKLEFLPR